ncbi:PLP-dependent aminotransferase family protein [Candidatus Aquiluna sp. UB-MaderosW2red]|jgi:DNA-binding transcriptional MocR family regulator|uniref:aminotransferase-like domain-containing protein n=1 Tax=Candidatus Aquiluna sp. UB-MaderosW2red TaxID=1855377 RepID=UPI000875BA0A|nr:PLP-dependent aminotransferase family protein [Candidatus Aquiluna sp. UB-MaderosW2red]SCX04468.1 DNA-binding transcriptional regulator, MocR family, contains an aminotransferase domain [Candidatus Aquiluna sp. UB-MaderosW2red]
MPQTRSGSVTNFDAWKHAYASRAANLSVSEVRALFAVVSRPEVVSLAGGMPDVSALDSDLIEKAFLSMMASKKNYALQYGGGQGDLRLREQIQEIMALDGVHGSVEDITITTGSQHGLELVADLFLDAGDVVLVEAPSYVGAVGIFRHKEAHIEHVFTDEQGISPEALVEAADRLRAEGKKIKLLYVVPNFANPSGVTLSAERRARVLEICKERGILIVEDNPYGLLYFDQKPPAAIASLDSENVVYLGSFSKILSPGLRVGYVLAPPAIREKLVLANESAILSPASFAQMLVSEYLSISDWQGQIETFRQLYKTKRDAALEALTQYLPRIETTVPAGGFFLWLTLPEGLNSKEMLPLAVNELVAYTPGTAFYGDGRGANNIRVCFSHPSAENVKVGIKRLSNVVNLQLDLLDTFSSKD